MEYRQIDLKLDEAFLLLKRQDRVAALRLLIPVIEYLNSEILDASRAIREFNPSLELLPISPDLKLQLLKANRYDGASGSMVALSWARHFGSDNYTYIGSQVRAGKQYKETDHLPDMDAVRRLATLLSVVVLARRLRNRVDAVTYVPSSSASTNTLPRNATVLISQLTGIHLVARGLEFTDNIPEMKHFYSTMRGMSPINGVMMAATGEFRFQRVVLVDDLLSSGTTFREACRALYASGCRDVYAIAMAKTRRFPELVQEEALS